MQLYTSVELPQNTPCISHSDRLMMLGSCFAESIGNLLASNKFDCDVNPFGILYNPYSIAKALRQLLENKKYSSQDLFYYGECYHSFMHHSSFSAPEAENVVNAINQRINTASGNIEHLNFLILTFGTAWVYTLKDTQEIVSNCHKLPDKSFNRRRLTVAEITSTYEELLHRLYVKNPNLKVVFTVSPIRHIKDGLHENQISKSTLLLSIDELGRTFGDKMLYFPSYEIMMDELRDYRFYNEDMFHPSPQAVLYIWEKFAGTFFSRETQNIMKECESIYKALNHKPFNKASGQYKSFLEQIVLKIERLRKKYPNLDVQKELDLCHTLLKGLPN